jgi:hypothetical protein
VVAAAAAGAEPPALKKEVREPGEGQQPGEQMSGQQAGPDPFAESGPATGEEPEEWEALRQRLRRRRPPGRRRCTLHTAPSLPLAVPGPGRPGKRSRTLDR